MPKQIKLTDSVADTLSQRAAEDNLSLAGEVAKLLTIKTQYTPEHTQSLETLSGAVDSLAELINKRFDELKSLIEDHLVDALASSGSRQTPGLPEYVEWPQMQYILFGLLDENSEEWVVPKSIIEQIHNSDYLDMSAYEVKDGVILADGKPLLKVTPRVREAIDKKRVYE